VEKRVVKKSKSPREGAVNPDAPKSVYGVLYGHPPVPKNKSKPNRV